MSNYHQTLLSEIAKVDQELNNLALERQEWLNGNIQHEKQKKSFIVKAISVIVLGALAYNFLGEINWFPEEAATRAEYNNRVVLTQPSKAEKIAGIIQREVAERCPVQINRCWHSSTSTESGDIRVKMSWPTYDGRGKVIGTEFEEWTSEASVFLKN